MGKTSAPCNKDVSQGRMLRRKHEISADLTTRKIGADESPLTKVLTDTVHAPSLKLADGELRRLYLWLDGNAPFHGAYETETRLAQKTGRLVPPPALQ